MKCPICNGKGYVYNALGSFNEDCGHCQGTGTVRVEGEPMTNEEYLKSLDTEQLAERLASTFDLCGAGCHHCFLANVCLTKAKNGNCLTQEQMIVEWLKQPHTPKE